MRPLLKPALRRVWRDPETLQFGLDPERAVVIAGLDPPAARFVESLDGTRDLPTALAGCAGLGLDERRARRLLDLLGGSGLLEDAATDRRALAALPLDARDRLAPDLASLSLVHGGPDGGAAALARRARAAVAVVGAGRVGASVATLLCAAGVGTVVPTDRALVRSADTAPAGLHPAAVGGRREDGARVAMRRLVPAARTALPRGRRQPDLAVLAPAGPVDDGAAEQLLRASVPHLLVTVRETVGVVGPMVLPGVSSCLRCADLHRADRDPAWPRVAAQLATRPTGGSGGDPPVDTALATLVAAQAVLQVLAVLDSGADARPPTVEGTLETRLPAAVTRRRSWPAHPSCGCQWRLAG